jgi:DNA-binding PadR family transcriptional regulator
MDLFEERVLSVLNDGKPRFFAQLLGEMGFSRNTLKLRLKRLTAQSLVTKEKTVSNGLGRPKYTYHISPRARRQVSAALSDPAITIVILPFSRIRHLCRFDKGGYCKQARNSVTQEAAHKSQEAKNKSQFWPIKEHACAQQTWSHC